MSKESIKGTIDANIKQNGQGLITGVVMNSVLKDMVDDWYAEIEDIMPDVIEDGFYICNENGEVIASFKDDKWEFLGFEGNGLVEVAEDGFYICNEVGEAIATFVDGKWKLLGLDAPVISSKGYIRKEGELTSNQRVELTTNSVKVFKRLVFSGTLTSFSSFKVGHGNSASLIIDSTNITLAGVDDPIPHGLTIANNLQVEIWKDTNAQRAKVKIVSNGESFQKDDAIWSGDSGAVYIESIGTTMSEYSFAWTCSKLNDGLWLFGDSYFSHVDPARWTNYLYKDGFTNLMLNAHGGENSATAFAELNDLLRFATPRKIVWCLGMNDSDVSISVVNSSWLSVYHQLENICKEKSIELILATIPTSNATQPVEGHSGNPSLQEAKNEIVRTSGYRYIDFALAVGAYGDGEWFEGMKNTTDVHPTIKGAKALYQRALCDIPEIMQ